MRWQAFDAHGNLHMPDDHARCAPLPLRFKMIRREEARYIPRVMAWVDGSSSNKIPSTQTPANVCAKTIIQVNMNNMSRFA